MLANGWRSNIIKITTNLHYYEQTKLNGFVLKICISHCSDHDNYYDYYYCHHY